ncbi:Mediator of RNA polymerase II transcription subunit 4 [Metarhizium album ARSEF 1941]|uniref:Mediator of RNA polymerase II transcription subunit 4 n=1 Tax=Metarhizium album (strain ARSEF 1941) TaxID=1081103 RepID=A0A0B2WZX4_METAS|nr:Mediator of RNA polymerase II transcription subunit 4 [Metarhizium album ARSEF 1941]KHN98987.1 Mediator of RNA polymerase II transcription subunit 4 [Metarhizium album ARSEF 1941]
MDQYIDSRFERLEKALSNLIDSVTKYHPSTLQAEELKTADNELTKGLEEVQIHQNNYIRIQKLRQSSAALDAQIRETLTSLANTHKDVVTTRTTTYPSEPNYPIAYEELLRYARRISKTTLPPAATIEGAPALAETQSPNPESHAQASLTPSARTPSQSQSPAVNGTPQLAADQATQQPANINTSLPEGMSQYLNPLSGQLFFPWPLEDKIRSGSLASYQVLVEQGIDPKGYDPATEEERKLKEEEERKAKEELEKAEREAREKQLREEREKARAERERQREKEQAEWRRASIVGGQPDGPGLSRPGTGFGEKKQFQFTNLDLDDDDDE